MSKSTGKKRGPKKKAGASRPSLREMIASLARWTNYGVFAALLIAVVAGAAFGLDPLRRHVGQLRADPLVLDFAWPPIANAPPDGPATWLNEQERQRLTDIALAHLTPDPFDAESLEMARAALDRMGWFREPPTIRREPGGVVRIEAAWRRPGAVVRWQGADHLVARDSALLPVRYATGGGGGLPVVVGTYTGPPRDQDQSMRYGVIWPGGDVGAALALIDLLRRSDRWPEVREIDVSRFVSHGELMIVTTSGGRIVWGAAPGAEAPGEVDDQTKLQRFDQLFRDPAWLGADRPPIELHMRVMMIDESATR